MKKTPNWKEKMAFCVNVTDNYTVVVMTLLAANETPNKMTIMLPFGIVMSCSVV